VARAGDDGAFSIELPAGRGCRLRAFSDDPGALGVGPPLELEPLFEDVDGLSLSLPADADLRDAGAWRAHLEARASLLESVQQAAAAPGNAFVHALESGDLSPEGRETLERWSASNDALNAEALGQIREALEAGDLAASPEDWLGLF